MNFCKRSISLLFLLMVVSWPSLLSASEKSELLKKTSNPTLGFIENKGQIIDQNNQPNSAVLYLLNTPGMNIQLRRAGFSYDFYDQTQCDTYKTGFNNVNDLNVRLFHRIDIDLVNANPKPVIETYFPSDGYLNYYTTGTSVDGVTYVKSFGGITYRNVYPGIDLQFIAGDGGFFEYNFLIQPEGDISSIQLKFSGSNNIKPLWDGIRLNTILGDVDETIPVCFYSITETQVPVKGRFKRIADHIYGFSVDQDIPKNAILLIDPVPARKWGTYYGGSGAENFIDVKLGSDNNLYLCGVTNSAMNIATSGTYQTTLMGGMDGMLVCFSKTGQRIWATYFGGTSNEAMFALSLDNENNLYCAGNTSSTAYIASPGAWQTTLTGFINAFLGKFTNTGIRIWSTYYGGSNIDDGRGVFADNSGNVFLCGKTFSTNNIASPGSHQPALAGGEDAFLAKFTTNGNRIWGTYYGGTCRDQGYAVRGDQSGTVFLVGETNSADGITTPGAHQTTLGNAPCSATQMDGFLVRFDSSGVRQWGTYYGGSDLDHLTALDIASDATLCILGNTSSQDNLTTPGSFQPNWYGLSNMANLFLAKFTYAGQRIWGTYCGGMYGEGNDFDVTIDDSLNIFICADSHSADSIATPDAYQPALGVTGYYNYNAMLVKFNADGQRKWGTYYGDTI